jgi:hypothetical protein
MRGLFSWAVLALATGAQIDGAQAQPIKSEPPVRHFTSDELAKIPLPDLKFTETQADIDTYEKYFYFHREGTSFDEAYADIKECDALASGIRYYGGQTNAYYGQYGAAGALGGAIGNALADAIFGSAQRRKIRRINLRNCMGYKEYQRYGLEHERWLTFNFEEGNGREKDATREPALLKQARVASGPKPQHKVLEP